jgi:hypothetical protein
MGIPLQRAWWILVYYAVVMLVCNIGGEELWWRGYVLPRQELAFGKAACFLSKPRLTRHSAPQRNNFCLTTSGFRA